MILPEKLFNSEIYCTFKPTTKLPYSSFNLYFVNVILVLIMLYIKWLWLVVLRKPQHQFMISLCSIRSTCYPEYRLLNFRSLWSWEYKLLFTKYSTFSYCWQKINIIWTFTFRLISSITLFKGYILSITKFIGSSPNFNDASPNIGISKII
jgi:hypothetical protein